MYLQRVLCGLMMLCLIGTASYGQSADSAVGKALSFPARLLGKLQSRTAGLDQQLTQQTEKYLQKMQRREERARQKMSGVAPHAAKEVVSGAAQPDARLGEEIQTATAT